MSSDKSFEVGVEQIEAVEVRLSNVMENPGPFKEVSNVPMYLWTGLIFHRDSGIISWLHCLIGHGIYLVVAESLELELQVQVLKDPRSY